MGTYADEDPNASIGDKIINSIKKSVGIAKDPTKKEPRNASSNGETAQETVDRMAGGGDENTASNAGSRAQSSDAMNKY